MGNYRFDMFVISVGGGIAARWHELGVEDVQPLVFHRAAAIQSLLVTAKLNGLNPARWLKDTLEKLPVWPNSRIDELLPFAVADIKQQPEAQE
jgi:hypothetical protein